MFFLEQTHFCAESTKKLRKGFTLLEMLLVVILIAILSSVVLAFFPNLTDGSRQSSTVSNLRTIASAMSMYHVDNNHYPIATDIQTLKVILEPIYIGKLPTRDGWSREFMVNSSSNTYTIGSGGKGWNGSDQLTTQPVGPTQSFESHIILTDGEFTQYPVGVSGE